VSTTLKQIAVVEDNPDNRLLVRVILEPRYQVTDYENGFAALEGLGEQKPDLVLLDVSLPEMDGAEVLRRIRADPRLRHLPVIALTAHAMSGDREKFLAEGFDDYISKPIVDETLLLGSIEKLLSRGRGSSVAIGGALNLDPAALQRLRRLGGEAFEGQMIDVFLQYAGAKVVEVRAAHASGNLDELAKAAHPLKSSAGNVGASRVQDLATRIEMLAHQAEAAPLTALVGELECAFAAVKPELEKHKHELNVAGGPGRSDSDRHPGPNSV
jgi:CheY-like chemotaxis protein